VDGHPGAATMARPGGVPEWPKGTGCKPVGSAYGGSNPPAPTCNRRGRTGATLRHSALLAQLVEHLHGKEGVDGSSPSEGSAKAPHVGAFSFRSTCSMSNVQRVWSCLWSFRVEKSLAQGSRRDQYVPEGSGRGQRALVNASGEFLGAGRPKVGMDAHSQVGDGCGIPADTLMDDPVVYQPGHPVRPPVDGVSMEVCGGVEAEIDPTGRAAIAKAHGRAIVAGIEIGRRTRLVIRDSGHRMERLWSLADAARGSRWQIGRPRKRRNQGKTVATGCHQLPWDFMVSRASALSCHPLRQIPSLRRGGRSP
jgi:hypothetical protein